MPRLPLTEKMDDLTAKFGQYLQQVDQYWDRINDMPDVRANFADVFRREFSTVLVSFQWRERMSNEEDITVLAERDEIVFRGSQTCNRFIRFLGPGITRLALDYMGLNAMTSRTLNQLIVERCGQSLTEIRLFGIRTVDGFSTFPLVQTVHIIDSDLGVRLNSLAFTFFPNARNLEMTNVRLENFYTHFEHLQRLRITSNSFVMNYGMRDAANLWYDNRYLRSLEIEMAGDCGMSMNELLDSIRNNESLSTLSVKTDVVNTIVTRQQIDYLIVTHPELRRLHLSSYMFTANDAIYLINRLPWLEYFAYQTTMEEEWNNAFGTDSNIELIGRLVGNTWHVRDGDYMLVTKIR